MENIQIVGVRAADRELAARVWQIEAQHREITALSTPGAGRMDPGSHEAVATVVRRV